MKRVAVIGLGNIATRHRRNLKLLFPEVYLYSMSASGRVTNDFITDCDQYVSSLNELIVNKVELVIIASPASYHAQHAIPLIEAGIPSLIEKPIATSLEDAKRIQYAISVHQTPVSIGYCLRYMPSAIKLQSLLKQKKAGTLYGANIEVGQYLPDWRPNKDYRDCVSAKKSLGGGVLYELSHELDYAQWLLGPLELKYAMLRSSPHLDLEVEDQADIFALTKSSVHTLIHLDFLQRQAYRKCSLVGSEGRLEWSLIQNSLVLTTATETLTLHHDPLWDKNQMYLLMIEDFVQKIKGNSNTCIEFEEAMETVKLICEIKEMAIQRELI